MKSIFTKLTTLLLAGAVVLVGCSDFSADLREVNKNLEELKGAAATKAELATLKAEVEELAQSIAATYATKAELTAVSNQVASVNAAVEALEALVAAKADNASVQKAIDALSARIDAIKSCTCTGEPGPQGPQGEQGPEGPQGPQGEQGPAGETPDLSGIEARIEALEDAVEALVGCTCEEVDLTEVYEAIEALAGDVETYMEEVDAALEEVEERLSALEDVCAEIPELQEFIDEVNETALEAMLLAELAFDQSEEAMIYIDEAYEELYDLIDTFEGIEDILADVYTKDEVKAAIAKALEEYSGLNDVLDNLQAQIDELAGKINSLSKELRSIVMVPQILVDGAKAVEFKSFSYVPMADENEEAAAETVLIPSATTVVYFHFNPSNFDVDAATYSVVSAQVETRSAAEPVATVSKVEKDGDMVKVEFVRANGAGNMFALAAKLSDGNVIYSDYALILDEQVTAEDLVIYDVNDQPLETDLEAVKVAEPNVTLSSNDKFSFADVVKPIDPTFAALGLEYKYSIVYGNGVVEENGKANFKGVEGIVIVKVEAVNGTDVVSRAYLKAFVNYEEPIIPGTYFHATTNASVEAARLAFEVSDIAAWAKALKDEPNTIEILKNVMTILGEISEVLQSDVTDLEKNFAVEQKMREAYELLNGVPGFLYKYRTFTGIGEATVKVELLPEVSSILELKAVLQLIEETYPQADLSNITTKLDQFIPESLKDNSLVASILEKLYGFKLSDILENDTVINLLETGTSILEGLGVNILDYTKINDFLADVVEQVVGENNYGEVAAELAAKAKARAEAELAIQNAIAAANEEVVANIQNGTWAQVFNFLNFELDFENETVIKILDQLEIREYVEQVAALLEELAGKAQELVQYSYTDDDIVFVTDTIKYEVVEE